MGIITSSTILKPGNSKSNSGYNQIPAERRIAFHRTLANATVELMASELDALFPRKVGDTSSEAERDEEIELRFSEFMKKGACKESFTALKDCVDEAQSYTKKCQKLWPRLSKCMHAHSDYHQPVLNLIKACKELLMKDMVAFISSEMEAAESKQAER